MINIPRFHKTELSPIKEKTKNETYYLLNGRKIREQSPFDSPRTRPGSEMQMRPTL